MIQQELLRILACPVCRASVSEVGEGLVCRGCGRRYPIRNGIPVMLFEESSRPEAPPRADGGAGPR